MSESPSLSKRSSVDTNVHTMQPKQKINDGAKSPPVARTRKIAITQMTMNAHEGNESKIAKTFDARVQKFMVLNVA